MALKGEITETLLEAGPSKMNLTEAVTRALKKDDSSHPSRQRQGGCGHGQRRVHHQNGTMFR